MRKITEMTYLDKGMTLNLKLAHGGDVSLDVVATVDLRPDGGRAWTLANDGDNGRAVLVAANHDGPDHDGVVGVMYHHLDIGTIFGGAVVDFGVERGTQWTRFSLKPIDLDKLVADDTN